MSSSDSDGDYYGNIAQKLQLIKNKYKIESSRDDEVPESPESEYTNKDCLDAKLDTKTPNVLTVDENKLDDSGEVDLDLIIAQNSKKRVLRSSRKKAANANVSDNNVNFSNETLSVNTRARRSGRNVTNTTNIVVSGNSRQRGRRKNSGQRGGNASRSSAQSCVLLDNVPIFSVGNTDYYPDKSDNIGLFQEQGNDRIIIDDEPEDDDIEELSVKVYWQSLEICKFMLRKYQKFTIIFDYFSKKENVDREKLFFTYNDKIISVDDTPESIAYNISKFIEGGIVNHNVSSLIVKNNKEISKSGFKIKFQCQMLKKPYQVAIEKNDKMHIAMIKCAEHLELAIEKLKFYFDGDLINGKLTPEDLELEGGECIDVKII